MSQIENLTSIIDLRDSVVVLPPTPYAQGPFGGSTQGSPYVNIQTTAACCFTGLGSSGGPLFRYSGFLNITLYATNATQSQGKLILEVSFGQAYDQEGASVEIVSTPLPMCGDCLSPGQSLIVPVISDGPTPIVLFVNFGSVGVSESLGVTYRY